MKNKRKRIEKHFNKLSQKTVNKEKCDKKKSVLTRTIGLIRGIFK